MIIHGMCEGGRARGWEAGRVGGWEVARPMHDRIWTRGSYQANTTLKHFVTSTLSNGTNQNMLNRPQLNHDVGSHQIPSN